LGDRITYVELDVHKDGIVVAVAEGGRRGEVREYGRIAKTLGRSGLIRHEGIGLTDRRTAFEAAVREAIGEDCLLQAALHPLLETRNAVLRHGAANGATNLRACYLERRT
jgi:hypothetical protein